MNTTGNSHLDRLLLSMERERNALIQEDQDLKKLPLNVRKSLGHALFPLEVMLIEHRSRSRINVVLRGHDLVSSFEPGTPIWLSPVGKPDVGLPGRVEGIDPSSVEIRVSQPPEGKGPWFLSKRLDLGMHDLQVEALKKAATLKSPLAKLLLGYETPYLPDPWQDPAFDRLDPSQKTAAELALGATEIGLIHGPPGTGKTRTLVAIMQAIKERGEKSWALADSNMAVDNLARQAAAAGLNVVRIGVSARIGNDILPLTLEHRILHGARAEVIRRLLKEAQKAQENVWEIREAINEEWSAAKREILESSDVIAMTLGSLQTRGDKLVAPKTALIDEVSQISEPAIWLLAARVKRLILAGDPLQLGPVISSRDPVLEKSLLQRLIEEGFLFPMLTRQYRMHDALLKLSAKTYQNKLTSDPRVAQRTLQELGVQTGPWTGYPARFVDTAGTGLEEEADGTGSYANPGELGLLKTIVASLREAGVLPEHIGIITPYSAQLRAIQSAFPDLDSGTVNAFQGREKEVILASFVRSNADREVGFVADPRRLNVAITRARRLFIGIGDSETLGTQPFFRHLFDTVAEGYTSAWELL